MRIYFLLIVFLLLGEASYAQIGGMGRNMNGMNMMGGMGGRGGGRSDGKRSGNTTNPFATSSQAYLIVDQKPSFPGDSLQAFLNRNIHYPEQAKKDSVEGRVVIMMIVHRDGSLDAHEVIRSSGNDELDAEAMRVVQLMPYWVPGRIQDTDVDAYAKVPVDFSLNK